MKRIIIALLFIVGVPGLFLASIIGGYLLLSSGGSYTATTSNNEAAAVDAYVSQAKIDQLKAETDLTLAQAGAISRDSKTRQYQSQTERMSAEDNRMLAIAKLFLTGLVMLLVATAIVTLAIQARRK